MQITSQGLKKNFLLVVGYKSVDRLIEEAETLQMLLS